MCSKPNSHKEHLWGKGHTKLLNIVWLTTQPPSVRTWMLNSLWRVSPLWNAGGESGMQGGRSYLKKNSGNCTKYRRRNMWTDDAEMWFRPKIRRYNTVFNTAAPLKKWEWWKVVQWCPPKVGGYWLMLNLAVIEPSNTCTSPLRTVLNGKVSNKVQKICPKYTVSDIIFRLSLN